MTKTNCIICKNEFVYKGYKKKCCSDSCLSMYRNQLSLKQHNLSYENVIGKIEEYIVDNYQNFNIVKTLRECLTELHIAPKTYYKYCNEYNISYDEILAKYRISKQHSKFQTSVMFYVKLFYSNSMIIEEATFEDCLNPTTENRLKFDAYIQDKNIIIECDGVQHSKKDAYFNTLTLKAGYTPSYITDKIKDNYCKNNNLKMIRIPYSRNITKEYVESFLCA